MIAVGLIGFFGKIVVCWLMMDTMMAFGFLSPIHDKVLDVADSDCGAEDSVLNVYFYNC